MPGLQHSLHPQHLSILPGERVGGLARPESSGNLRRDRVGMPPAPNSLSHTALTQSFSLAQCFSSFLGRFLTNRPGRTVLGSVLA